MQSVEWGEYKLGDLFEIENTLSFNSEKLVDGDEYDYVTRTSGNQGILRSTGFVNEKNLNNEGTWSLGLLQMDFFYRKRKWYAGQFVRKITPKIKISKRSVPFFSTVLNQTKSILLSVLVRNVNNTFKQLKVYLPTKTGKIDFDFMEKFMAELEVTSIEDLKSYLSTPELQNYNLTEEEKHVVDNYDSITYKEFNIVDIFNVKNTSNLLSRDIIENSGNVPYLCASSENNAVNTYINYNTRYLNQGNCVFIGGKTFVVTYQHDDFFSNDSHNIALYLKDHIANRALLLGLVTCVYKSLSHKYSWGNSISNAKIKKDTITLPTKNGKPDFYTLELLSSAFHKLMIKSVVEYTNRKIATIKNDYK